MARKSVNIDQKILDLDAQIKEIQESANKKIKSLKALKENLILKKNEHILKLIQESGLDKMPESDLKAAFSKIKG